MGQKITNLAADVVIVVGILFAIVITPILILGLMVGVVAAYISGEMYE